MSLMPVRLLFVPITREMWKLVPLGTDIVVSSTEIITRLIEQEVDLAGMHLLATLNKGKASYLYNNLA